MTWNLNSLTKDNFNRVQLIEAHNSLFNYDLIAVNETGLNDSIEIPEFLLDNYTFINANNAANQRHGGVGLFYKNSLPLKVRDDLSFAESIVIELKFRRKSIFFTILYRSPASSHNSPEFAKFLNDLQISTVKSVPKNHWLCFLLVILMLILCLGGLLVIIHLKD